MFLLEVEWDSRMTREGYDQCLGISHNLSPILPWCTQLTRYQLKIKVKWSNYEVSWTNVRKTNKTICIYRKTQQCGKPNCSHEFSIISTPTDCSWILYFVKHSQCLHLWNDHEEGYNLFLGTGLYGGPFLPLCTQQTRYPLSYVRCNKDKRLKRFFFKYHNYLFESSHCIPTVLQII